jgi:hypothetical protein
VVDAGLEVLEEAVRALEPAVRHCGLAAKEEVIGREQRGDPRRGAPVAAIEVEPVGAFSGVEGEAVLVEHVTGPAESFERLRRLVLGDRSLEEGSCALPVAAAERRPACVQRGDPRHFVRHAPSESGLGVGPPSRRLRCLSSRSLLECQVFKC